MDTCGDSARQHSPLGFDGGWGLEENATQSQRNMKGSNTLELTQSPNEEYVPLLPQGIQVLFTIAPNSTAPTHQIPQFMWCLRCGALRCDARKNGFFPGQVIYSNLIHRRLDHPNYDGLLRRIISSSAKAVL